jgi:class 3 adenylate cyclase
VSSTRALPTGTVTLLFTDIEGSTRLLERLGDAYADALAGHRRVLREAFERHHGVEVDAEGDAFFVAFPSASDAVAAAIEGDDELARTDEIRVRIGMHTGEPIVADGNYVGMDVHRAARIAAAGHGGQILLSETTRALLGGALPEGAELRDLGGQKLKDIGEERIYQLAVDGQDDYAPLKTEVQLGPSKADILGDDFEQRIEDFVRRSIAGSFAAGTPQRKAKSFWSRLGRRS